MINYTENEKPKRGTGSSFPLIFGVVLIAVGSVIALYNLDIIGWRVKNLILSWQMLLIVIGIINLGRKNDSMAGIIMILIGGFFIFPKLHYLFPDIIPHIPNFSAIFWPLLLILIGAIIISKSMIGNKHRNEWRSSGKRNTQYSGIQGDGTIDANYIFSGSEQVFLDPIFKGGRIRTVFGGMELDLRRTTLPEGITHLRVETVFGGVTLIVPESWDVRVVENSFLGGFSDKRRGHILLEQGKQLIIEANCVFGGGEVK